MKPRPKTGKKPAQVYEAHVRLYRHELECPAYRQLSTEARALLVEMRALYSPKTGDNRVFMGVRDMMKRCNLSQRAATRARDELLAMHWIALEQMGGFSCKVKHASVFRLENEPPNTGNGSYARKGYMRWEPDTQAGRDAVLTTKNRDSRINYRSIFKSTTDQTQMNLEKASTVSNSTTDMPEISASSVAKSTAQIGLPPEGGSCSGLADSNLTTNSRGRSAA